MKKPDELLKNIERSNFSLAIALSMILHIVLIAPTSISLFRDWKEYGVHSPSYINSEKKRIQQERADERRREEAEKKALAEEAKAKQVPTNVSASTNSKISEPDSKEVKKQSESKPLPTKKSSDYRDDIMMLDPL